MELISGGDLSKFGLKLSTIFRRYIEKKKIKFRSSGIFSTQTRNGDKSSLCFKDDERTSSAL